MGYNSGTAIANRNRSLNGLAGCGCGGAPVMGLRGLSALTDEMTAKVLAHINNLTTANIANIAAKLVAGDTTPLVNELYNAVRAACNTGTEAEVKKKITDYIATMNPADYTAIGAGIITGNRDALISHANAVANKVCSETFLEKIIPDELEAGFKKHKPTLIIAGAALIGVIILKKLMM